MIKIEKDVYDKPELSDGKRILVMKIWPRGISKGKVDVWVKDLGTDKELIKKWKDGKIPWTKFATEYRKSLKGKEDLLRSLAEESKRGTITLLCTDKDPNRCHRSLLKAAVEEQSA
jgi:uncharacterized protein YeaO (DUF488 family)